MKPRPYDQAAPMPALTRLAALAPLGEAASTSVRTALGQTTSVRARRDVIGEGTPIRGPLLIAQGWAARVRQFADGRRQFLSFLLPGDLIGMCHQPDPVAVSTVTALTDVEFCPAPPPRDGLEEAYAISQALEEGYLLEQITRLGRLNAMERICSLLLEFRERLMLNGLSDGRTFALPLTQEVLGDALGLTAVHINRMIQEARRAGDLALNGGYARLPDPAALATRLGRVPMRVTACPLPDRRSDLASK